MYSKLFGALLIVLALSLPADADAAKDKKRCAQVKQKIAKIQSRMRQPYSAKQSARYQDQLLALRKKRYKYCL